MLPPLTADNLCLGLHNLVRPVWTHFSQPKTCIYICLLQSVVQIENPHRFMILIYGRELHHPLGGWMVGGSSWVNYWLRAYSKDKMDGRLLFKMGCTLLLHFTYISWSIKSMRNCRKVLMCNQWNFVALVLES